MLIPVLLTSGLLLAGCSAGETAATGPTKAYTIKAQSESTCAGAATVHAVGKWTSLSGEPGIESTKLKAIVTAYCKSRGSYKPALNTWDIGAATEASYGKPLATLTNYQGKSVKFGTSKGFQWQYSYNNEWWFEKAAITGDIYQTVQIEVNSKTVAPTTKAEIQAIFDSAAFKFNNP